MPPPPPPMPPPIAGGAAAPADGGQRETIRAGASGGTHSGCSTPHESGREYPGLRKKSRHTHGEGGIRDLPIGAGGGAAVLPPNQPPELAGACACACGWEAAGLAGVEDELDAAAGLGLEAAEEAERAGAGAARRTWVRDVLVPCRCPWIQSIAVAWGKGSESKRSTSSLEAATEVRKQGGRPASVLVPERPLAMLLC
jgi:hypothetical protein